ncbi:MAG: imidazolonepropionase-like amidohydrolase [Verrucomicrobiales bacterium]|jgi:imidazolonepropionase-like amidohydrolase
MQISVFRICATTWLLLLIPFCAVAQSLPGTRPSVGINRNNPRVHALVGAKIVCRPGEIIPMGTVIIRDGIIAEVGQQIAVPADARVWDLNGLTLYAGFIDGMTSIFDDGSKVDADASHWNTKVRPERQMANALKQDAALRKKWRGLGFTSVGAAPEGGIFRGSSTVLQLGDGPARSNLLRESSAQHLAFETGGGSGSRGYPSSLMGSIALIRQTLSDARWNADYRRVYTGNPLGMVRPEGNAALQALEGVLRNETPLVIHAGDELDYNRAFRVAEEAEVSLQLAGNGYEYRQIELLSSARSRIFLPVAFPGKPPVDDPDAALDVTLEQLQHWNVAPSNPALLDAAGIEFAFSTQGHKEGAGFWKHVRESVERGLDPAVALAALTTRPSAMLRVDRLVGEVASGRIANLTIFSGDPFSSEKAKLFYVWIDGDAFPMAAASQFDPGGEWSFKWGQLRGPKKGTLKGSWPDFTLEFADKKSEESTASADDKEDGEKKDSLIKLKAKGSGERLVFTMDKASSEAFSGTQSVPLRLAAHYREGRLSGIAQMPDGSTVSWFGKRKKALEDVATADKEDEEDKEDKDSETVEQYVFEQYPAGAFGTDQGSLFAPESILIRGATVWTCDGGKPLKDTDVLFLDGRIVEVAADISTKASHVIDGHGKHVTPGLLDAHSHIAISRGLNEGSHAVTVEVRIGDVVDPTDIGIYRQLAGGLTTSNLLHGSANPMGGQNQVVKLRWGKGAEEMKFVGAKPGVKFALGENVKQSNWGASFRTRYPQTRMGVEQVMKDTFQAARNYDVRRSGGERAPFRKDLRMEAALEILKGDRIVHIHSYRQDEILMFVRLAEQFGFTVGTFQHVLEGYKVADAIAGIGAGGSSFSDWWAYKFEVYDAIPYNGAIMHDAGVLTSFNSDDAELGRRMNTEAAKAVKYGGIPEEIALQFVTLNPARQLRVDDRVGSLEVGKDADFVVWSDHPLSTYARAEQTWIDGTRYFSLKDDAARRKANAAERQLLITKALMKPKKDSKKESAEEEGDDKAVADGAATLEERWRLMTQGSLADYHKSLEYRDIYHNGENLHTCSGDSCSSCRQ